MNVLDMAARRPATYRKHLLKCGVGVKITSGVLKLLRKRLAAWNTPSLMHPNVIACAVAESENGQKLLLFTSETSGPLREFLLREVMKGPKPLLRLADEIHFVEKWERTKAVIEFEDGKRKIVSGRSLGWWLAHELHKGWNVTHMITGLAVAQGLSKTKAEQLAKALARSPYPWGLVRSKEDMKKKEWRPALEFAKAAAKHAHSAVVNPVVRQKTLFD